MTVRVPKFLVILQFINLCKDLGVDVDVKLSITERVILIVGRASYKISYFLRCKHVVLLSSWFLLGCSTFTPWVNMVAVYGKSSTYVML